MSKYALVHKDEIRVHDVVSSESECYEIHSDFTWYECSDEVNRDYDYVDGNFIKHENPKTNYTIARKVGYGDTGAQLGSIYDSIINGEDALSVWAEKQRKIKILFPKDNEDAVEAANDEVRRRQFEYYDYATENNLPIEKDASYFTLEVAEDFISGKWENPVTGKYIP